MIKLRLMLCIWITCGLSTLHAQNSTVAAGGDASGSNGSVSYSVGQTSFMSAGSSLGSVQEGEQQPFEISIVAGLDNKDIDVSFSVYPNPATESITVKVNDDSGKMNYTLFDNTGKLVDGKTISSKETKIAMNELAKGVYFLNIFNEHSQQKSFKIIKNN